MKKLTKKQMEANEKIARDILAFLKKKYCWEDICIFFNGKAWSSNKTWNVFKGELIEEPDDTDPYITINGVYEFTDIDSPKHWTEYANEDTVTLVFDGAFYEWINYHGDVSEFENVLEKYNAYFEMGEAFNLSIYFN